MIEDDDNWIARRKRRRLQVSASQLETFSNCKRQWWAVNVRGLPTKPTTSQVFGTVLHSVVERFLTAGSNGRDASGRTVDLYPKNWHIAVKRYGKDCEKCAGKGCANCYQTGKDCDGAVTPAEQSAIKKLIEMAIEDGVLERPAQCAVEKQINIEMRESGECPKGKDCSDKSCPHCSGTGRTPSIGLIGFVDLITPEGIQDHKTTKSMRYAKSKNELAKNIQMLLYAYYFASETQAPDEHLIELRHNVYCAPENRVKKTVTHISALQARAHFKQMLSMAEDMASIRDAVNDIFDLPMPLQPERTCNAYGGCPLMSVCTGQESLDAYEKRAIAMYGSRKKGSAENYSKSQNKSDENCKKPLDFCAVKNDNSNSAATVRQTNPNRPMEDIMATETPAEKLRRLAASKNAANPPATTATPPPVNTPFAPAQPAAAATPATPPAQQPAAAPAADPAAVLPEVPAGPVFNTELGAEVEAPPWAKATCKACRGRGWRQDGKPCMICEVGANSVKSKDYTIEEVGVPDVVAVTAKSGGDPIFCQIKNGPGVAAVAAAIAQPLSAPPPAPAAAPAPEPEQPKVTPITEATKNKRGRPAKDAAAQATPAQATPAAEEAPTEQATGTGETQEQNANGKFNFVLLIGCVPSSGGLSVVPIEEVLNTFGAKLAEKATKDGMPASNYWAIDAFKRRDALSANAQIIASVLTGCFTVPSDMGPDVKALVEALKPYATAVFVSTK